MCETARDVGFESRPLSYLMTWVGLVGVTVGLSLPIEVAAYASKEGLS